MKKILEGAIGKDGGTYGLSIEDGNLVAKVGYPVSQVLEPLKKNFVDKLKAVIPGDWDDALIDKAWQEAVDYLSEKP